MNDEILKEVKARGGCEWCTAFGDNPYWEVTVFNEKHRICNSCYIRLKAVKEASEE